MSFFVFDVRAGLNDFFLRVRNGDEQPNSASQMDVHALPLAVDVLVQFDCRPIYAREKPPHSLKVCFLEIQSLAITRGSVLDVGDKSQIYRCMVTGPKRGT